MKFSNPSRRNVASIVIDLTPLIDVVFLLLLFFLLTTAPAPDPTLAVNLPKAESAQ
ncbi:MAG: biopolymer transporter ExbD, partial [Marichromatium sp.]|nr:biopolymer transporter ExbD [Marichromatium sp.]